MFKVYKHIRMLTLVLVVSLALTGTSFAQPGGGSPGGDRPGGSGSPDRGGASQGGSPDRSGQSFQTDSFAQEDRPAPSTNGGNLGGPSMGGEAVNAGRTDVPAGGRPSTDGGPAVGGDVTQPEGAAPGGNLPNREGGELPITRGDSPLTGDLPMMESFNQIPEPGSAAFLQQRDAFLATIDRTGGGGFGLLEGSPSDLAARFGERGTSDLPIDFGPSSEDAPPWATNFEQGGFGANTEGETPASDIEFRDLDSGARRPAELEGEAAPGGYDNLSSLDEAADANDTVAETQQDVVEASDDLTNVDEAGETQQETTDEQRDENQAAVDEARANQQAAADARRDANQEAANEAAENASNAYDTYWEDYYEAVDATADTYYDTTTAVADYYLDVYVAAVDYTTDSIDYYIEYAEQYSDYCAVYPFDCYSYTYDYSTNTYYYIGDSSSEAAGTTEAGTVSTTEILVIEDPEPSADAYQAIVVFANDHLAAAVDPLYAGTTATTEVDELLARLPVEIESRLLNSTSVSGETYWGLLNGGVAGVMVGDCTDGECAVTDANLSILISTESAGVYGLLANTPYPPNSSTALQLITDVYPKLEGLVFTELTDVDGYAYTASAAGLGYDEETQSSVSVTKVIYAGTIEVDGQPFVYVLVGVGETYTALIS